MHFGDSSLEGFYFLDVPWIFDLMGSITKMPNNNGKIFVISFLYSVIVNQFIYFYREKRESETYLFTNIAYKFSEVYYISKKKFIKVKGEMISIFS